MKAGPTGRPSSFPGSRAYARRGTYVSRHGATKGIAERIADRLRDDGLVAETRPVADVRDAIPPRGTKVFFGAMDPDAKPIGFAERLTALMPAAKAAMPKGDFRDWPAIDAWADEIAHDLAPVAAGGGDDPTKP